MRSHVLPGRERTWLTLIFSLFVLGAISTVAIARHDPSNQSPSTFAQYRQVWDVEVTSNRVLVTQCGSPQYPALVTSFDHRGNPTPFATIPYDPGAADTTGCQGAAHIAVSPGLPGFPKGHVYASYGRKIWQIPPGGCTDAAGELCPKPFELRGPMVEGNTAQRHSVFLAFDETSSFSRTTCGAGRRCGSMIAAASGLQGSSSSASYAGLWTIDPSGLTEHIGPADAPWKSHATGQPAVAPEGFGSFGGHLFIPYFHEDGVVRIVSPSGGLAHTVSWRDDPRADAIPPARGVSFVRPGLCELGDSGGFYFQAKRNGAPEHIRKFPSGDFTGDEGKALLANEDDEGHTNYPGMVFLTPDGSGGVSRELFHSDANGDGSFTDGDFAECPDPWSATLSDTEAEEGGSGSVTKVRFRLTLASPPTAPINMHYETRPDTAQEGSDYLPTSGDLTFGGGVAGMNSIAGVNMPSETTADIEVSVVGDDVTERNERFFLEVTDPSEPEVLQAQGVGTILNDDIQAPSIPEPPESPPSGAPQSVPTGEPIGQQPPPPAQEVEALPFPSTHTPPVTAAAPGANPPPPAPPGSAPAPSAGPAPGAAPGPGPVAGQSSVAVANPVSVPAFGPAPAPQVMPGVAGMKEEQVQAAPESDYAMVAVTDSANGPGAGEAFWAGAGLLVLAAGCSVAAAAKSPHGKNGRLACPCFPC